MKSSRNALASSVIAMGLLVAADATYANKADKYKEAAESRGCMSIPEFWGDLRSPCLKQTDLVHEWCDGRRGPVSCTDDSARSLLEDFNRANTPDAKRTAAEKARERFHRSKSNLESCIDYRRAIMNVFSSVIDRTKNESDEKSRPYAQRIMEKQIEERRGHEIQITQNENRRDNCKEALDRVR